MPPISGPGDIEHKLRAFFLGVLGFFDRKKDFCEHAIFEMGADVRKKAMQRFEVVFKAQVAGLADAAGRRPARRADRSDRRARDRACIIVGAASGLAKQRLRGWVGGPVEEVGRAGRAARFWKGLAAR